MASLSKAKRKTGTYWRLDFFLSGDRKRKHIHLGKMTQRQASAIKTKIELLIAAKVSGTRTDLDVMQWVAKRDDKFHDKLAQHGLVASRTKVAVTNLGEFLDDYMAKRQSLLDVR